MSNRRLGGALAAFVILRAPCILQAWPSSRGAEYRVEPGSGALSWVLTVGTVPGDLPVTVAYRHQGTTGSLHFGYITPAQEGRSGSQVLEDGRSFLDADWEPDAKAGTALAQAYGFTVPAPALDPTRTVGYCDSDPGDLGRLGPVVSGLTASRRLKVVFDHRRARIFAFHDTLNLFLPVLWVDRFGHEVRFRWQEVHDGMASSRVLQVTNALGKGLKVTWPAGKASEAGDILQMDFFGMRGPSLRVQGRAVPSSAHPFSTARPDRVSLGESGDMREWTFGYETSGVPVLNSLRSPQGLISTFTWGEGRFPDGSSLLGVTRAMDQDVRTGTTFVQTWHREIAGAGSWSVSHVAKYSDGMPTEGRRTDYTFSASPAHPFCRSERILGAAGTERTTTFDPLHPGDDGRCTPVGIHVAESGSPAVDVLRTLEPPSRRVLAETVVVGGENVQTRTMEYGDALPGESPSVMTTTRQGHPAVMELRARSAQGALIRHTIRAGGQERGKWYTRDADGRRTGARVVASWTSDTGMIRTWEQGPLGKTGLTINGHHLVEPLRESWVYTDRGQVGRHTDAKGNVTTFSYDLWGRPLEVRTTGLPDLRYAYPDENTRTWSQGRRSGVEWKDGFGRFRSRRRGDGVTETFATDTLGRIVSIHESDGTRSRLVRDVTWDALDRICLERSPWGPDLAWSYRAEGTAWRLESRSGLALSIDPWGQVISRSDAEGTTRTTHNAFGQVTRLTRMEPGGLTQTRSFKFDSIGNLTEMTEPETLTTTFADFNALGQCGSETDASGRKIRRSFDALGRVLEAESGGLRVSARFRGPLLVGRETSEGLRQTFTYSAPGSRMDSETLFIGGVERTVRYEYDSSGSIARMTYPCGRTVTYGFDSLDRIVNVAHNGAPLASVTYDGWGNLTRLGFSSGAASSWRWDDQGRRWQDWTVSHAGGTQSRAFTWDGMELTGAGEWLMLNDRMGRLREAAVDGMCTVHDSDGFGNAIFHGVSGTAPSGFNAFNLAPLADNRMPGVQPNGALTGWVVGSNGEPSQVGTGTGSQRYLDLAWDGFGRLTAVSDSIAGNVQSYRYGPQGMLARVSDSANPGLDRQFVYSDRGQLLAEYHGDGRWNRDVLYLGDEAIAEVDGSGVHELHCDHLGTPRIVTAGTGTIEGRQDFGPFGEPMENVCGYAPLTGFTGHLRTETTGLIYMRARFFSPTWHRFLSPDRGAAPLSWNRFTYADGTPFLVTDPTGMADKPPFAGSATVTVWGNQGPIPYHLGPIPNDRPIPYMGIPGPLFAPNVPMAPPHSGVGGPPASERPPDPSGPAMVCGGRGSGPTGMTNSEFEEWRRNPNNIFSATFRSRPSPFPPVTGDAEAAKAREAEKRRKDERKSFEEYVAQWKIQKSLEVQFNNLTIQKSEVSSRAQVEAAEKALVEALKRQGDEYTRVMRITRGVSLADAQKNIKRSSESINNEIQALVNAERAKEGLSCERVKVEIQHITGNSRWGHLVIKVGEGDPLGLVPDSGLDSTIAIARNAIGSALTSAQPFSSFVGGRIVSKDPKEKVLSATSLEVSQEEALVMIKYMEKAILVPQIYHPISRNCVSWVREVLKFSISNVPTVVTPEEMVKSLIQQKKGQ